jgi:hypothetical protein
LLDGNLGCGGRNSGACPQRTEEATMRDHQAIQPDTLRDRILQLESEHSELDRMIDKLAVSSDITDLELRRLKKRKLKVKDDILLLQLQLEPDRHA